MEDIVMLLGGGFVIAIAMWKLIDLSRKDD